jgi:glycine/D-amino acid oxidase-like deaminating enzyme
MSIYDWVVVGNGLAGAALSYELAREGFSVMLVDSTAVPSGATRYSYGGIAYWSGTTDLMRQLCQEGIERHRTLSAELDGDTEFRDMDLLLTIDADRNPEAIAAAYAGVAIPPILLDVKAACDLEPLLDGTAIAGALCVPHGHVSPQATVKAYNQAFVRAGGTVQMAQVTGLMRSGRRVEGVITPDGVYQAAQVAVCAGGMSRAILRAADLAVPVYYTQAELIETPPVDLRLQTIVMPAELKRFGMEAEAGRSEVDSFWDEPGHEVTAPILDAGAVQFRDGRLRLGQISRTLTDPGACVDASQSNAAIRAGVGRLLPTLQALPGEWHSCLVAFSGDRLPLMGALPETEGIHLFSGFSNPFAILPPLAQRFARHMAGQPDRIVTQLSPERFATSGCS